MENTKESNLVLINTEDIHPHPDNPRKDLGDLTELTESIKKNGIMQNLTVIPGHWEESGWEEDGYTLIIGHRRFAAGKAAGLEVFPCRIIDDMEHGEQVATMLEENMQRNDLTIWEQANGFQMMLDLGITEEQISERTGFSKTTVRHRLNIAKLNQDELKKKEKDENFQLTLKDLYELEKVKDIKKRNSILKNARDSYNLRWLANVAVNEEKVAENKKKFIELFNAAGIPMAPAKASEQRWNNKWEPVKEWRLDDEKLPKEIKIKKKNAVYVFWNDNRTVAVVTPKKKEDKKLSEWEIKQQEREKRKKELKQKNKELCKDIETFIKGIVDGKTDKIKETVELYGLLIKTFNKIGAYFYGGDLSEFWGNKSLYELKQDKDKYNEYLEWEKKLTSLDLGLIRLTQVKNRETYDYYAAFKPEKAAKIQAVVNFLEFYGFSVTEEQEKLLDGSDELYMKGE